MDARRDGGTVITKLKIGSLFSGYGGLDMAVAEVFDAEVAWFVEFDKSPSKVLEYHWPEIPNYGDITKVDWSTVEPVDILCGGSPCFPAGTLVDTLTGYKPIESISTEDTVRTHTGRYMPVVQLMNRMATDTIAVKVMGAPEFVTTREHPFWVRKKYTSFERGTATRDWSKPEWVKAGELSNECFVGFQLDNPDPTGVSLGEAKARLIGRWLGDGWTRTAKRASRTPRGQRGSRVNSRWWQAYICCSHDEVDELAGIIQAAGYPARISEVARTVVKFCISSKDLVGLLTEFGSGAAGKKLPGWVYRLPLDEQRSLWEGWISADGSVDPTGQMRGTTVSVELAHGMSRVARNAYQRATSVHRFEMPKTCVIEGRTVNQRDQYQVCLPTGNREAFVEDGWVWTPVRHVREGVEPQRVFNFGVQEDESYTAWGIAVHNCQDLSHAGRRAGMTEGTRSNLWVQMRESIAQLRPSFVVWENVRGAFSAKADSSPVEFGSGLLDGGGIRRDGDVRLRAFGRVLGDLADLGYDAEWVGVRAADVGAPHGRYRVFLLAYTRSKIGDFRAGLREVESGGFGRGRSDDYSGSYGEKLELLRTPVADELGGGPTHPDTAKAKGQTLRLNGQILALVGELLPTPLAGDSNKAVQGPKNSKGQKYLTNVIYEDLPPTPTESKLSGTPTGRDFRDGVETPNVEVKSLLDRQVWGLAPDKVKPNTLLPTPTAMNPSDTEEVDEWEKRRKQVQIQANNGDGMGTPLSIAARKSETDWGAYEPAIRRWEAIREREAPPPTLPDGKDGKHRLNAKFVEWMMGLEPGHVTAEELGLSRSQQIKMLGNGVVPQQAYGALSILVDRLKGENNE